MLEMLNKSKIIKNKINLLIEIYLRIIINII